MQKSKEKANYYSVHSRAIKVGYAKLAVKLMFLTLWLTPANPGIHRKGCGMAQPARIVDLLSGREEAPVSLSKHAKALAEGAKSAHTRAAYKCDQEQFFRWCRQHDLQPLPATPGTVAEFLAHLDAIGRKVNSIKRMAASISILHREENLESPTGRKMVTDVLSGIRRKRGQDEEPARPIRKDLLRRLIQTCDPTTNTGKRDRALILLTYAAAARASEALALRVQDVRFTPGGLLIRRGKSKTDQTGERSDILGLAYRDDDELMCPTRALATWLETAHIESGPIFRSFVWTDRQLRDQAMTVCAFRRMLKTRAETAGIDPNGISTHGLRAGLVTDAAHDGATDRELLRSTRHRSLDMLAHYDRPDDPFEHGFTKVRFGVNEG